MVSAQIPCLVRMYKGSPNGNKKQIFQARIEQLAPAGGASEGAGTAVSTPEKLLTVASNEVFHNDDIMYISFTADAAATIGAVTKSIWSIPTVNEQGTSTLGRAQFANPTMTNQALVAAVETFVAGYRVVEGSLRLQGKIYLDLQSSA
jgi:hypothetical protein